MVDSTLLSGFLSLSLFRLEFGCLNMILMCS